jgi:hypothetical protein
MATVPSCSILNIEDLEFRSIARAIRDYLRTDYALTKTGEMDDPPPLRISAYSARGVGHYQTAPDGRADWSPEMERYMERQERREPRVGFLRFGFSEVDNAMTLLHDENKAWFNVLLHVDVLGEKLDDYAVKFAMDPRTAKRHRQRGTFFLYRTLRLNPAYADGSNVEWESREAI